MIKLFKVCLFVALIILTTGCARRLKHTSPASRSMPFYHVVRHPGETLGVVAIWYTGDVKNWEKIRDANPALNPSRIEIGDSVLIPENLVIKRDELPKDFVNAELKISENHSRVRQAPPSAIRNENQETSVEFNAESDPESDGLAPATEELIKTRDDLWRELMGE